MYISFLSKHCFPTKNGMFCLHPYFSLSTGCCWILLFFFVLFWVFFSRFFFFFFVFCCFFWWVVLFWFFLGVFLFLFFYFYFFFFFFFFGGGGGGEFLLKTFLKNFHVKCLLLIYLTYSCSEMEESKNGKNTLDSEIFM